MNAKVLLLAVALIGAASAQNLGTSSFCQRYAAALFPGVAAATAQTDLITAVVGRALLGNTSATAGNVNVRGILNVPSQVSFFTNFGPGTAARTTLVAHLVSFFTVAMNCKDVTSPGTFNGDMKAVHASMAITRQVWDDFVGQLVDTLLSFGVPGTNSPAGTGEIVYAAALLGQFLKGPTQICNAADCLPYSPFVEFWQGAPAAGGFAWYNGPSFGNSVDIPVGGTVHWNFGGAHNVVESDASYTPKASPLFTSGPVSASVRSYTYTFATAGVYYFVCNPHQTTMRGIIRVGQSSDASGLQASLAIAAAAAIAALALKH